MFRRRDKSNRLISNIDVTAFGAVMLVLAMIVMAPSVWSPDLPSWGVDLPRVNHPRVMRFALREDAITVGVTRDGKLYFGNDQIDPNELPERIRRSIGRGAERKVYIRADARAQYGAVKDVLNEVQEAGVSDVAFLCNARHPHDPFQ
jgi:biopolymer transport protein TolR